jgi:MFS family permease
MSWTHLSLRRASVATLSSCFRQNFSSSALLKPKILKSIDRNELFDELKLKEFTTEELSQSYHKYLTNEKNSQVWNSEVIQQIVKNILQKKNPLHLTSSSSSAMGISDDTVQQLTNQLLKDLQMSNAQNLTFENYEKNIRALASKFDPRVLPIALSFLLTGLSIGIIVPCMPLLVQEIQLTSTEFGIIISSFGLSKLMGNIPSTYYVNTIGRKPLITGGLGMTALGIAGYGTSLFPGYGFPIILGCRLFTGLGVSGITTGGQMYISDISTSLNRVQTMNPVMMSFQAGMSLGPAIGGIFIDSFGIGPTYFTVGGMIMSVALLNHFILAETNPSPIQPPLPSSSSPSNEQLSPSLRNSLQIAVTSWRRLIKSSPIIRETLFLNGVYWVVLSGTQFAMLPLIMVSPVLHMTVGQIGMAYAAMSLFSVTVSQPIAYLADRSNKKHIMLAGCTLAAASTAALPFVTTHYELIAVLLPLSLGSAMMNNLPSALLLNLCEGEDKAQALSLLRTVGDFGFILGGTMSGVIAAYSSIDTAILTQSSLLLSAVALVAGSRHLKIFN